MRPLALIVCAALLACGGETDRRNSDPGERAQNPPADPELFADPVDVPQLSCEIEWSTCAYDEDCCYGPCRWEDQGCIGCFPPGLPCFQHEECCSQHCSTECSLREETCPGVCLLAEAGKPCHNDKGCISGRCVDTYCK